MTNNYVAPQVEVIEVEIEDAVLGASIEGISSGYSSDDWDNRL